MFFRKFDSSQRDARSWRPIVSADVATWCKEVALVAGIDSSGVGAKSLRMGCATDMYDIFGPSGAQWLDERGRWDSDIGQSDIRRPLSSSPRRHLTAHRGRSRSRPPVHAARLAPAR